MKLKRVLKISRPRFWIYELGPFMIWVLSGILVFWVESFWQNIFWILLFGFYFLIPANILIYWINDIFDYETDKTNQKKLSGYEALVLPSEQKNLWYWIVFSNLPFLLLIFFTKNILATIWLDVFIFFASFYSALPIRAKSKSFWDSFFSASHYIATAIFWYFLIWNWNIDLQLVLAGLFWAFAMHAYSAVPDIQDDKSAWLNTVAIKFWAKKTILICAFLYILAAIFSHKFLWIIWVILWSVYVLVMMLSIWKNDSQIFKIYKYFPYINMISWAVIFFSILLKII